MKKVLFATTALVATAGVAAADVTFGGYGRFGLQHQEDRALRSGVATDEDTIIESRFRLNIDASTESDAGVTFGARVRLEINENGGSGAAGGGGVGGGTFNGARFHAETGGFRLEVGNIAHALDNLANYYGYEPGLIGAVGQYANFSGPVTGYTSGGAGENGVSAIYSMGDFRAQLSYDGDSDDAAALGDSESTSVSVAYTFSGWTVALGYEESDDGEGNPTSKNDGTVLTVGGSLGVADVALFIGDDKYEGTSYGISGRFDVGASTKILASVSGGGDDVTTTKKSSYGIGFDHDLGGGVALRGMVGRNTADQTVADLGVIFNF
ncbi:porin [Sulfitobacter sp. SK011]|uniref:porin n=1 Tax=Sulfitobacter sp. SK011 TaxID=1389004 RepID=UPI000E0BFF71|nr:porin [Sulfitobacter sp. SK011]AXI40936.1 porin [Sulfitobacter sp. SK011]